MNQELINIMDEFFSTTQYQGEIGDWNTTDETYEDPDEEIEEFSTPTIIRRYGGPGSGHHGHAGRPGMVGGSGAGGPSSVSAIGRRGAVGGGGDWWWQSAGEETVTAFLEKSGDFLNQDDASFVKDLLLILPEKHLNMSAVKVIKIGTSEEIDSRMSEIRPHRRPLSEGQKLYGFFTLAEPNKGELHALRGDAGVLFHEFGHSLHHHPSVIEMMNNIWEHEGRAGKISSYGKTSPKEAFADAYRFYAIKDKRWKERAPETWAIMDKFFNS